MILDYQLLWGNVSTWHRCKGYAINVVQIFASYLDAHHLQAVERLPALHYSVDFIFLSFGVMGFIVELWNY